MNIKFTSSLSGKLETFKPIKPKHLGLYVCGLTPYDSTHLGHARVYVIFDIVRRTFEAAGYKVRHIQNFTDIDDRILDRSKAEGISPILFAGRFIEEYFAVMKPLNVKSAHHYPRVTQYIPQIIKAIKQLIDAGCAYVATNGDVYFQSSKFPGYGKLSKKKLEDLIAGARVEVSAVKKEPADFALWKADSTSELSWDSPWSRGRPGWHMECSVMSAEHLGQPFDIHGGGEDLIFPHHENEIAQSEGPTGVPFAHYFIHNGFVTVDREKMSKSTGNFFKLSDLLARYSGQAIRYYLLSEHYRRPLDFSDISLEEASNTVARIKEATDALLFVASLGNGKSKQPPAKAGALSREILSCLVNDFHTPSALAALHEWAGKVFTDFKSKRITSTQARSQLQDAGWAIPNLLGLDISFESVSVPKEATTLIGKREKLRKIKNFKEADVIRDELKNRYKLTVEDTPYGPRAKKLIVDR